MGKGVIELFRCCSCNRLLAWPKVKLAGSCYFCGGRQVRGASPISLVEKIKCFWWSLTLEGE
jgi:DNA polymerase II large subunit